MSGHPLDHPHSCERQKLLYLHRARIRPAWHQYHRAPNTMNYNYIGHTVAKGGTVITWQAVTYV
eukprot:scaffold353683_cov20-Prasinocladus_malaysianus.AAC.1